MKRDIAAKALKPGLKFFVIGAILALCAPYIGAVIGLAPNAAAARGELGKMGNPWLVGLFFAGIGALDALLKPVFDRLFKTPPGAEKPPQ